MSKKQNVHIQARISKDLRDEFQTIASQNAQNPSALIRLWIKEYIKENKKSL